MSGRKPGAGSTPSDPAGRRLAPGRMLFPVRMVSIYNAVARVRQMRRVGRDAESEEGNDRSSPPPKGAVRNKHGTRSNAEAVMPEAGRVRQLALKRSRRYVVRE